jgi:cell division protein FtsW (lipid II flippase)
MEKENQEKSGRSIVDALKISSIPVFIASLCCLAPIVLVTLGISTVTFAASLSSTLYGEYRWLFIGTGIISLIVSLVFYFRKRGICTIDQAKKRRNEIINKVLIVGIVALIGYHLFFNIFLTYLGKILGLWS